jgi:hypothetical protein
MTVRIFGVAGSSNSAEDFRLAANGLYVPTSQLNTRTGVTSSPVLTGTGSLTCTVGPFSCVIDGTSNALQGSYWATLDSATTVTINAGSSQARIDLISLQIQDNAYDGSGFQRGQIVYTAGTPGSGVAPATPANSIPLFNVPVAALASSVNFASATAVYPFTAAAGGIVPVRSSSDAPAAVAGVQYRHRLDVSAAAAAKTPLESSTDGITWTPVFDPAGFTWTTYPVAWASSGTAPVLGAGGTLLGSYMKIGRLVIAKIEMNTGSATTFGTGSYSWTLPFTANVAGVPASAFAHSGSMAISTSGSVFYTCTSFISQAFPGVVFGLVNGSANFVGAANPAAFAGAGCQFQITIAYESTT